MSLKSNLITALEQAYQHRLDFVDQLPEPERSATGAPDHWTAKDVMAHMTEWSKRQIDELDAQARGDAIPVYGPDNDENARIYAAHRDLSWDAIRQIMVETHARCMAYVHSYDDAVLSDPALTPWGDAKPAWKRFTGNTITHSLLHLAMYESAQGRTQRAVQLADSMAGLLMGLDDSPEWRGEVFYNQACLYALAGHAEQAISKLSEALRLNSNLVEWSKQDTDLASLRGRADYQALYSG